MNPHILATELQQYVSCHYFQFNMLALFLDPSLILFANSFFDGGQKSIRWECLYSCNTRFWAETACICIPVFRTCVGCVHYSAHLNTNKKLTMTHMQSWASHMITNKGSFVIYHIINSCLAFTFIIAQLLYDGDTCQNKASWISDLENEPEILYKFPYKDQIHRGRATTM